MRRIMFKRILTFCLIIMAGFSILKAENKDIKAADKLYAQKKYAESAVLYKKVIDTDGVAPELYYNLGNAYYKYGETGLAILNYERALRLNPMFEDAAFNLEFANQKVIDNVVMSESFFLRKWINLLIRVQSSDAWFITGIISFLLTFTGILLFIFGRSSVSRKAGFYAGVFFLVITISSVIFSFSRYKMLEEHREAIILSGAVIVKSSPDKSGTDLFQLHEGTKVAVQSELDNWVEIRLGNGNEGWVEARHLEKI